MRLSARPRRICGQVRKANAKIVHHAEAIKSCIEKFDPARRWYVSLAMFGERDENGAVKVGWDEERKISSRMREWVLDLKKALTSFPLSKPQELCTFEVSKIFRTLAPVQRLAKGDRSKFYLIASWMWEAVTGKKKSMKRACDACIDMLEALRCAEERKLPYVRRRKGKWEVSES